MRASAACARPRVIMPLRDLARPCCRSMVASAAFDALLGDVVEHDVVARQRADMRDAVAHLARADDADLLECRCVIVAASRPAPTAHAARSCRSRASMRPPDATSGGRLQRRYAELARVPLSSSGSALNRSRDQAVVGDLEDRRFLVLVDGDDDLGVLHAGEMLDRAGDADGDVELGRDDLAGLADLLVVRRIAGVDRGARGADGGAQLVGQRLDVLA